MAAWLLGEIKAMVVMRSPITVERRYVLVVVQYIYPGQVEKEEGVKQGRAGPSHCHSCPLGRSELPIAIQVHLKAVGPLLGR